MFKDRSEEARRRYANSLQGRESLRDLVEDEAARCRLPTRKVWRWALEAIARDVLPPQLPDGMTLDTRLPHPSAGQTRRGIVIDTLRAVDSGSSYDPAKSAWTARLMFDRVVFGKWLKGVRRAVAGTEQHAPGPKSERDRMREALDQLQSDGQRFPTKKTAYAAVLKHCGIKGDPPRGWSYDVFRKACPRVHPND
jgi:hypothetical protein